MNIPEAFKASFARPFVLSPMAGYSDSPFRRLCRRYGSAFSVTEFVSTEALVRDSARSIAMFRYDEEERPVVFQIFGHDPDVIVKAAQKVIPLNPDGIDLNMGCSVKKVAMKGAGAALLKEPKKVKKIISQLVKNLPVPVSAKIRLGWDAHHMNYREIAHIVEGEGAWQITVHGRTRAGAYDGNANWDAIGDLKSKVSIPVFGNGDITSIEQAKQKMQTYGVDGVYIGRATMGNPWLFSGKKREELNYQDRLPLVLEHFNLMLNFYGEKKGVMLFRKHLVKYVKEIAGGSKLRQQAMQVDNPRVLKQMLLSFQADVTI